MLVQISAYLVADKAGTAVQEERVERLVDLEVVEEHIHLDNPEVRNINHQPWSHLYNMSHYEKNH